MTQSVYMLYDTVTHAIKVGMSSNIAKRLKVLNSGRPVTIPLRLVGEYVPTNRECELVEHGVRDIFRFLEDSPPTPDEFVFLSKATTFSDALRRFYVVCEHEDCETKEGTSTVHLPQHPDNRHVRRKSSEGVAGSYISGTYIPKRFHRLQDHPGYAKVQKELDRAQSAGRNQLRRRGFLPESHDKRIQAAEAEMDRVRTEVKVMNDNSRDEWVRMEAANGPVRPGRKLGTKLVAVSTGQDKVYAALKSKVAYIRAKLRNTGLDPEQIEAHPDVITAIAVRNARKQELSNP